MKRFKSALFFLLIFSGILTGILYNFYSSNIAAVSNDDSLISIKVEYGTSNNAVLDLLKEEGLIKNKEIAKIYLKLNDIEGFQAGNYEFSKNQSLPEIVDMLENGNTKKDTLLITFKEGKTIKDLSKEIAKITDYSEEDVLELLVDEEYLDELINEYWFISNDIKKESLYYPLEGYLSPNTYDIYNLNLKAIIKKFIDQTDKLLTENKKQIETSEYSIHEILTLSSMVELEGNNKENRAGIAKVFFNRLDINMSLGSDVTSYYGVQMPFTEEINYNNGLCDINPYNTRSCTNKLGLPIGPISSISEESLIATLNPNEENYLYFMADENGVIYFSNTLSEQNKKIDQLKKEGLWHEYN